MLLTDLFALGLAAGVPVNAWLHKGGIFEEKREKIGTWGDPDSETESFNTKAERRRGLVAQLLICRFCLSHHTPWILILLFYLPSLWLVDPWSTIVKLPVYSLAATRLSLLLGYWIKVQQSGPTADPLLKSALQESINE
jgi:hypothetical protein